MKLTQKQLQKILLREMKALMEEHGRDLFPFWIKELAQDLNAAENEVLTDLDSRLLNAVRNLVNEMSDKAYNDDVTGDGFSPELCRQISELLKSAADAVYKAGNT